MLISFLPKCCRNSYQPVILSLVATKLSTIAEKSIARPSKNIFSIIIIVYNYYTIKKVNGGVNMHLKDLGSQAMQNTNFRTEIATSEHTQMVIMSVNPGEDIGLETHHSEDQVLYLLSGNGKVLLNGQESDFNPGDCVLVPAGVEHNFTTVGNEPMKIITTYSPPHHPKGTVHKTKADAEAAEAEESH